MEKHTKLNDPIFKSSLLELTNNANITSMSELAFVSDVADMFFNIIHFGGFDFNGKIVSHFSAVR